ncbi:PREDICTED: probable starch synthase 4, chloroplastic/amyloplastic isoform X2 [Camelina sativa]|uniref:starch synthase n=1 Tax=Camelina sativa TaxID=90675 RepID=A0ABM0ZLV3_CAMSA|nr:PREDICTED: probable starch synthase 4, chloroplastic/amyloplastic isoform X1 [Camelina sativa]XP_010517567.1 PREDICTED: probable starch synthase 4, chloroplastic/amyloplastic isoform X2 [Camelina sativa]
MTTKLSSFCFLTNGLAAAGRISCEREHGASRRFFYLPSSRRLVSTSCKMRQQRGFDPSKRQQIKKGSPEPILSINSSLQGNNDEGSETGNGSAESVPSLESDVEKGNSIHGTVDVNHADENTEKRDDIQIVEVTRRRSRPAKKKEEIVNANTDDGQNLNNLSVPEVAKALSINKSGGQQISDGQFGELMTMIRNAEKNILRLDQSRASALDDLNKILSEKESLQGEINVLEMKLAETDDRIKTAAQEKVHVELLEEQLEKLRHEMISPPESDGYVLALSKELETLKMENLSLRNDIDMLKSELESVKNTGERVVVLEEECSGLESSVKDLESKLSASQEDVSNLSTLKTECTDLWAKVENLQLLLDRATKQAEQAVMVLQQNQDLRNKVDKIEESLKEANVYKESSEKIQQYNELMQHKVTLLEERLEKSDAEIFSYVKLYQESIKEFQETLESLKEESKRKSKDEPVDDMPWDYWSRLLLTVDGWLLEKKIVSNDADSLREMVWKKDRRIHDTYIDVKDKNERDAISAFLKLVSSPTSSGLYVVHIAAEMAPVAKVGGLGDVVAGLGKALQRRGHLVEIILPKYDCMKYDRVRDLRALDTVVESYFDGKLYKNKIWIGTVEGLPVHFIEPQHPSKFFWRGQFYGEQDDFRRFSYFSRAALELLLQSGKKPDIIHCHDWQTAFVAPLYWDLYAPKGLDSARICFTCHNFEYQGTASASELGSCGLDVNQLNRPDRMQDHSSGDRVNPVKGAIIFSNIVTTVSPTYAQEVRTSEGGKGLHSTLNLHSKKFIGILNGIDTDSWNPATDPFLKAQFNVKDLQGKEENKYALRKQLGLSSAESKRPLVGCITRLVPQKGVHLIRHAIYRTLELGGQFVLLGSSPVPHIQREFEGIEQQFKSHDHVRLLLKYDEALSHTIYAASDMFIIPSIFEPCGLTQMIAMRYGSIPIVRKTGGLNDSVFDIDDDTIPSQFQNGFTFQTADEQSFNYALERAFKHYKNDEDKWMRLIEKVMSIDFSWGSSATQYEELYTRSVARARSATNRM